MLALPRHRALLAAIIGGGIAVYAGLQIGSDNPGLAIALGVGIALMLVAHLWDQSIEAVLLGGALLGYILGNRGFAQVMPSGLPLFYAELALALGGSVFLLRCALARELPLRADYLNMAIVAWILISGARLYGDIRAHGIAALRDFAMVYYAGFFFLSQRAAASPGGRRLILRCLTLSTALLVPLFLVEEAWMSFFVQNFALFGTPLILHKPDLVSVYAGVGLVWSYYNFQKKRTASWVMLFLTSLLGIVHISTRAMFVALFTIMVATFALGQRRFSRWVALSAIGGSLLLTSIAMLSPGPFTDTKLYSLYEHARSIVDIGGQHRYSNEEAASSGDNNRFRFIWWRLLTERTMGENPLFGLGWGSDLADDFIRAYNPMEADTFSARSPHNFLLTLFARSGLLGLAGFLAIVAGMTRSCWLSRDAPDPRQSGLWLSAWVVLLCACFGVVLEGPMGAVVFWILAGLANGFEQGEKVPDDTQGNTAAETLAVDVPRPHN